MDPFARRLEFDMRTFRLSPWKVWALAATGIAVAVAFLVAMAGMLLVLVPALLIGGFVARLLVGRGAAPKRGRDAGPAVIEGQYEVIEGPGSRWRR